ncbi:PucR family transcriptional regulator [Streptomyces sp. NPDC054863]
MQDTSRDGRISAIALALSHRLDEIVAGMADQIYGEIEFYRNTVVGPEDLHDSLRHNVGFVLAHLTDPGSASAAADLSAPTATGRKRAEQGVPLPEILRAYRLGFALFWDQLRAEAHHAGTEAMSALLHATPRVWALSDSYSSALTDSYRETVAERLVATDRRRSALVAALTDGPLAGSDTIWEVARMLSFPYQGKFLVVVAETLKVGDSPLPGLEAGLRALDVRSAWRAQPGHEMGVLSCPRRLPVGRLLEAVRAATTGRAGISPAYEQLDQTSRALRYAQVALESLPTGSPAVRQLDDTPLTDLVMNNLETTRRAVYRVLGGVLSLPEEDRTTLLKTAQAWLQANGSAAEAGRALYCHQNTVRYRMHRLEEFLRGPLDNPKIVAELTMALDAVGTFPDLLKHRHLPDPTGPRPETVPGGPPL